MEGEREGGGGGQHMLTRGLLVGIWLCFIFSSGIVESIQNVYFHLVCIHNWSSSSSYSHWWCLLSKLK